VSSISSDTSTPGEKGITLYRNVGIPLPIYAASYPRRYSELFLHRRLRLFGDEDLGSGTWRSLVALHMTVSYLLAKNVNELLFMQTSGSQPQVATHIRVTGSLT
jgi:hypothetical protein